MAPGFHRRLAAGVSLFSLARRMGTSVDMIDRTYGHLAPDAESYERDLLDAFDAKNRALGQLSAPETRRGEEGEGGKRAAEIAARTLALPDAQSVEDLTALLTSAGER